MSFEFSMPDFDLVELESDLHVIKRHLRFVEEQLHFQSKKSEKDLNEHLATVMKNQGDPAEEWAEIEEYQLWVREGLPRLVVNPFIVALWALFESTVTEVANLVQRKKEVALKLSDIKGKHFQNRIEKYFIHVLEFPFDLVDQKSDFDLLGAIRNAIVHSNGRVGGLSKANMEAISAEQIDGISESSYGGYLVIDLQYAIKSFELVEEYLRALFDNYSALRRPID